VTGIGGWERIRQQMLAGCASSQGSSALEKKYYGDPANNVELRGRPMQGTKEIESLLRHELDNWLRWGRRRDWMPVGFKVPLGYLYKSTDVHETTYRPLPCNENQAVRLERIIVELPEIHRKAFVMYQLDRAVVNGYIRRVSTYHGGYHQNAAVLGMAKSKYYQIVQQAHNMVLREWERKSKNIS
jgi:hypothetical protein